MPVKKSTKQTKFNPYRIRDSDLTNAIQPINKNKQTSEQANEIKNIGPFTFCLSGQEDNKVNLNGQEDCEGYPYLYDEDNDGTITISKNRDLACAYFIIQSNRKRYFVKRNTYGELLNPIGLYEEQRHNRKGKGSSRNMWEYREVGPKIFEFYLKFLNSKNPAWLKNAERELI